MKKYTLRFYDTLEQALAKKTPEHPGFAGGGRELGLTGGRGLSGGMMADLDKDICVLSKLRVFT